MANNRMNLVNTATGQRVLLATHFATKWRARWAKLRPSPLTA
jgi:hypothetical protein